MQQTIDPHNTHHAATKTIFTSPDEAAALIQDGMTIALGGMTIYRRPVGFVRTLLRRHPRPANLTLLCFTAGLESDLLVGAGCIGAVRSAYFGLEAFGLAPMVTQAVQDGRISLIEETEASLVMGIRAAVAGVSFMPSRAWLGTDLLRLRPDVQLVLDPYTGEQLVAFPAIPCDVAVLHALEADGQGNVAINNNRGIDLELVYLARTVIVTVERIVDHVMPSADRTLIPAPGATHIVHIPRGAWPTSCYPEYPVGGAEIMRYVDQCTNAQFETYLSQFLSMRDGD